MIRNRRVSWRAVGFFLLTYIALSLADLHGAIGAIRLQESDQAVILMGNTYEMAFDKRNGAIVHIKDRATGKEICKGNKEGLLWRIGRLDLDRWRWRLVSRGREEVVYGASQISKSPHIAQHGYPYPIITDVAASYSASNPQHGFFYKWEGGLLKLGYSGADMTVNVICTPEANHVDFMIEIENRGAVILTLDFPHALLFDARHVQRVGWPMKLGVCLKRPFYNEDRILEGTYPTLFSDFCFLESADGAMRCYGIQNTGLFCPTVLGTGSLQVDGRRLGFLDHGFFLHVAKGERWRSPLFRIEIGSEEIREGVARYGSENGMTANLSKKMKETLYERFCQSPICHFDQPFGNFRDDASLLHLFPRPMVLRLQHWMLGGFDRQYPNFLPPNPGKGTPDEFRRFCEEAEKLGFLVETYVNYTWASTDPPSPLFQEKGADILARNLDGSLYAEQYASRGYTLSPSHPAVKRLHLETLKSLVDRYGVDMIYHDQIGCRSFKYDVTSGHNGPSAYIQGIIDLTKEASEHAPIACEGGFDRLINHVSRFEWPPMGGPDSLLDLSMRPSNDSNHQVKFWTKGLWEPYPWLLFLFHDKVSFSKGAIDLPELSWALLIGAHLHTPANIMNAREREWLQWICRIQEYLGSQYIGKALRQFGSLSENIFESRFEGVHVICNLSSTPYRISGDQVISEKGFSFRSENGRIAGGAFSQYNGIDYGEEGKMMLFEKRDQEEIRIFSFYHRPTTISIKRPASWQDEKTIQVHQLIGMNWQPVQATITENRITFAARHEGVHPSLGPEPLPKPALPAGPPINTAGAFVMEFRANGHSNSPEKAIP